MLLLVDQGLCGLELWRTFHPTGAELLWRCRQDVKLEVLEVLADGSWASELGASHPKGKRVAVRVIDYRRDDPGRAGEPECYRLITTILDPEWVPAAELPALYPQRWELETALDELKTHQRGPRGGATALKRNLHRHWPQPTKSPDQAVVILTRTARGP